MRLGQRLQKTAARLLLKGDDVVVTAKTGTGVTDAAKPWRSSTGTADVTVKAVQYPYEETELVNRAVKTGQSRFIIAETDLEGVSQFGAVDLTTATQLTEANGYVWSIEAVEIIEPGADRIVYLVHTER